MTDVSAQMVADLTAVLNETGTLLTLDGVDTQVVADPIELAPGEFERSLIERKRIWYLATPDNVKVPGQIINLGGSSWLVATVDLQGAARVLVIERSIG